MINNFGFNFFNSISILFKTLFPPLWLCTLPSSPYFPTETHSERIFSVSLW